MANPINGLPAASVAPPSLPPPANLLQPVEINVGPSTVMHIDVNSCFAAIEQQANPLLRGKPVAVAAYVRPSGCILAASREAKALGITTSLMVWEGKRLCPQLIVLPPDPWKYRYVNRKLLQLFRTFTPYVEVKSIDEMHLDFRQAPIRLRDLHSTAQEIKVAIRKEVGEWISVSIGIAPNRYLAKLAAGLRKPDGLEEINAGNLRQVLAGLQLIDLAGIKERNAGRLSRVAIGTPLAMLDASPQTLMAAFGGIVGYYWHLRLRGWEIDAVDTGRKGLEHSYALTNPTADDEEVARLLCKLAEKVGRRMRRAGYAARGVHLDCGYVDGTRWGQRMMLRLPIFATSDIYRRVLLLYARAPKGRLLGSLAISCHDLVRASFQQSSFCNDEERKRRLTQALDAISDRWGDFAVIPARMMGMEEIILDRIGFGGIKDLEELPQQDRVESEPLLL